MVWFKSTHGWSWFVRAGVSRPIGDFQDFGTFELLGCFWTFLDYCLICFDLFVVVFAFSMLVQLSGICGLLDCLDFV